MKPCTQHRRRQAAVRPLPFTIDRNNAARISDQMTDGLRQAILAGHYPPGDELPTIRDMAKALGISIRAPLVAVRRLCDEGLLASRPRHGIVVVDKGAIVRRGHLLFVSPDGDGSQYVNILAGALRDALAAEHYLYTRVAVRQKPRGGYDFGMLDVALRQSVDLVLLMFDRPDIVRHLSRCGVPFAVISRRDVKAPNCIGRIRFDRNAAVPDFIRRCLAADVRSVLQICSEPGETDTVPGLLKAGIQAEEIVIRYPLDTDTVAEDCARIAMDWFEERLSRGTDWLPDLLFFADDVQATGALMALLHHGVRIPEDVRVVTWLNRGFGPVFWCSLSRMEMDPVAQGKAVANYTLSFLRGKGFPVAAAIGPHFVDGDTFPVP